MFSVNRPIVISNTGITNAIAYITAVPRLQPSPPLLYTPGDSGVPVNRFADSGVLTINDAPSLDVANTGNEIWSAPTAALVPGTSIPLGSTSNGLTISSVPAGVGLRVVFDTPIVIAMTAAEAAARAAAEAAVPPGVGRVSDPRHLYTDVKED